MTSIQHRACLMACCLATLAVASGCAWFPSARMAQTTATQLANLDGDLSVARLAERRGNLKRAKDIYKAVLEMNPGQELAHHRLAVIAAQEGQLENSIEHFRLAQQSMVTPSAELFGDLGYVEYLLGNFDAAQVALTKSLEIDPQNERTLNNLGLVAGMRGDMQESLACFRQAVGGAEAHANLAYVLTQQGEMEQAADHYHHALETDSDLRMAAHALVQIQRQMPAQRSGPAMPRREMQLATSGNDDYRKVYEQVDSQMNSNLVAKYNTPTNPAINSPGPAMVASSLPQPEETLTRLQVAEIGKTPARMPTRIQTPTQTTGQAASTLAAIPFEDVPPTSMTATRNSTADPAAMLATPAVAKPSVPAKPEIQAFVEAPAVFVPAVQQASHVESVDGAGKAPSRPQALRSSANGMQLGSSFSQPLDFQF